ncbi:fringe glycosyltransferase-like protein [Leptotrombidium deliense]|uniref:Fringe glycosyltransferase-like protein n=1 Tax=Leptotrombidium deliense TaxID=299467 RepID=A0A443SIC3_9ACAR|nr:fringe glycosyltransferase-like protein [Leptotrombidium deliense]
MSRLRRRKRIQLLLIVIFVLFYGTVLTAWKTVFVNHTFLGNVTLPFNSSTIISNQSTDYYWSLEQTSPKSVFNALKFNESNSDDLDVMSLRDIFISVKTTKIFHRSRVDLIVKTWFALAKDQTFFFTDGEDAEYSAKTKGHLINTNCSSSHNRKALCCKMSVEFDTFIASNKKWFCHFDDDNYVNIPRLVKVLQNYDSSKNWYVGKPSIRAPLEILDPDNTQQKISFWFATGGAGFCISRSLALKMVPIASYGKFISIGEKIRLPDDVTIGYIIEYLLRTKLTVVEQFHSHLEPMKFIKPNSLSQQITFSYSKYGQEMNVIAVKSGIKPDSDPSGFISLHCHLFPTLKFKFNMNFDL